MMLLCLANIGTSMANLFRFMYARVCCGYCNYVKRRHLRMKAASLSTAAVTHANALSFAALASTNLVTISNQQGTSSSAAMMAMPHSSSNGDQLITLGSGGGDTNIVSPQQVLALAIDTVVMSEVCISFRFFSDSFKNQTSFRIKMRDEIVFRVVY